MKKRLVSVISGILVVGLLFTGCGNKNETTSSQNISNGSVSVEEIGKKPENLDVEEIITQLTSDEVLSRVVGSDANLKSAQFIKNYFEAIGLQPFVDGSYFHDVKSNARMRTVLEDVDNGLGVKNVIGVIKGEDSSKAVVISAHFDHIVLINNKQAALSSSDSENLNVTKLQGAIDNASGVAVMLETAKDLAKNYKNNKPPYDIIFAAFNAEELGLIGSYAFVDEYNDSYDQWYNINIDCVGVKGGKGLAVDNNNEMCQALYDDFIKCLDKNKVPYEVTPYAMNDDGVIVGTSDHAIFKKYDNASLIVGQVGIVGLVHTEEDNLSIVDFKAIEEIKDAIVDFVKTTEGVIY